jgi:hypothetical protein
MEAMESLGVESLDFDDYEALREVVLAALRWEAMCEPAPPAGRSTPATTTRPSCVTRSLRASPISSPSTWR